jgi:hypothetical protein
MNFFSKRIGPSNSSSSSMDNFVVLRTGTAVYHKTWHEFDPSQNASIFYTLQAPTYSVTDSGQCVHEYRLTRDCRVLFEMVFDDACIKQRLLECMTCSDAQQTYAHVLSILNEAGIDGVVSRIDSKSCIMELLVLPPASSSSPLEWVRTFHL